MAAPVLKDVKKILIINLGGIGDMLLSFPAVGALRAAYKDASIDVLVVERVYELVKDSGVFDNIFIYKKGKLGNAWLLSALRKNNYDLAVNMRTMVSRVSSIKMFLLMSVINPRIRAGRDTDGRGFFFDIKIPETLIGDKHETEYDIDMAQALGAKVTDRTLHFNVDRSSADMVKGILEGRGIRDGDCVIGINAGGMPSRRWPVENIAKVMQAVARIKPCIFVLTGSKSERSYVERLSAVSGARAVNLAGELSLNELGALMERCNLYISNDTGPLHIAAILKRPLIAIFGPGYIKRFDPRFISDNAVVFYKPVFCAPCDKQKCMNMRCLVSVTPEEVTASALRLLEIK